MFGKSKRKTATTPSTEPSDQYRLKSTGQRVTLIRHLGNGDVSIAMDNGGIPRDAIVSSRDIRPA